MPHFHVTPSTLRGSIKASPSKSHTLRAILFATLARGTSTIHDYLHSPDTEAMVGACHQLGAEITQTENTITVVGTAGVLKNPDNVIDCGNSGQVLRFVAALSSLMENYVVFTGDHSIRYSRPARPLIDGLSHLGVFCVSTKNDGRAPLIVKGPLKPGKTCLLGHDSQPVSALLIACAFASGPSEIQVVEPGEKPWVDLTLDWFKRLGIAYTNENFERYTVAGQSKIESFDYHVPGDFSSLAFPIVAALLTQSEVCIQNVDMTDVQGDKKIVEVLKQMGANITVDAAQRTLLVQKTPTLTGTTIDVNDMIDAVPILAVVGCFAKGTTTIEGGSIARLKECDRLNSMAVELTKMGANITEKPDGLVIQSSKLHTAVGLESHHDHRIVMSLVVASLAAQAGTAPHSRIEGVEWVKKSYPDFFKDFQSLNAGVTIE